MVNLPKLLAFKTMPTEAETLEPAIYRVDVVSKLSTDLRKDVCIVAVTSFQSIPQTAAEFT